MITKVPVAAEIVPFADLNRQGIRIRICQPYGDVAAVHYERGDSPLKVSLLELLTVRFADELGAEYEKSDAAFVFRAARLESEEVRMALRFLVDNSISVSVRRESACGAPAVDFTEYSFEDGYSFVVIVPHGGKATIPDPCDPDGTLIPFSDFYEEILEDNLVASWKSEFGYVVADGTGDGLLDDGAMTALNLFVHAGCLVRINRAGRGVCHA